MFLRSPVSLTVLLAGVLATGHQIDENEFGGHHHCRLPMF
jgi:hypothetical protein